MASSDASLSRHIAIAGPTAAGKTAAALAIAAHLAENLKARVQIEIISVDSALIYRGMDIGTAKPTSTELAAVPHHLIDIRDPAQTYSAAEFVKDATRLMHDITARGKLPVLVGGTMLYFKALWDGLDDLPAARPEIRAELEREAAHIGWPAMHTQLAKVDPISAARLKPNDAQRIQRALEVFRVSGKPLSSFQSVYKNNPENTIDLIAHQAMNSLFISLEPQDRAWLHERIAQRFDAMLANGFEQEVRRLKTQADLTATTPAMRCVGYRQMWEALDAVHDNTLDAKTALDMRDKGIAATRQLCKRQLTWLRSNASFAQRRIVPCDSPHAMRDVLALVDAWLPAVG